MHRLNMHGMWPKGSGVEFKVRLMHANHVNAHASDGTIIITFDSQTHVIQVHMYCTKWATQENKCRAWSQLTAGQVFGKIRVLAKSRNRCKLSLSRFH